MERCRAATLLRSSIACGWMSRSAYGAIHTKSICTKIWATFFNLTSISLKKVIFGPHVLTPLTYFSMNSELKWGKGYYLLGPFKIPTKRSGKLMLSATDGRLLILVREKRVLNFLAPETKRETRPVWQTPTARSHSAFILHLLCLPLPRRWENTGLPQNHVS